METTFWVGLAGAFFVLGCNHASSKVEGDATGQCDCAITAGNNCSEGIEDATHETESAPTGDSPAGTEDGGKTAEENACTAEGEMFCNEASDCFAHSWIAAPEATKEVRISGHLDADVSIPSEPWDMSDPWFDPGVSSNCSTAVFVFDTQGNSRRVDVFFASTGEREWDYHILYDAEDLNGNIIFGEYILAGFGSLFFTEDGRLYSEIVKQVATFNFRGATPEQTIVFDFGRSVLEGDTGRSGFTSTNDITWIWNVTQDGHDGSGNWMCVQHRCVQHFFHCARAMGIGCCGDGTCRAEEGKNIDTCRIDCNWQCRKDADCIGGIWDATLQATRNVTVDINLDGGMTSPDLSWDPSSPEETSNHNEQLTVYDSNGAPHVMTIFFRKERRNQWTWYALVNEEEQARGTDKPPVLFSSGTLHFTSDGFLDYEEEIGTTPIDFIGALPGQTIAIHFSTANNPHLFTTLLAAWTELRSIEQDGHNGTGHWQCNPKHQCVQDFDPCGVPRTPDCCGDDICKTESGMDEQTCPSSCNPG